VTTSRLVVVGASLAGLRAIEAARQQGFGGIITLIGAEKHLPYDRPPLSKAFLSPGHDRPVSTTFRTREHLEDQLGVELLLGQPADSIDPALRQVRVGSLAVPYDALILATGSTPRTLPRALQLEGVVCLRSIDDAVSIRNALDAGARTVIIGGGFIGSEIASAARERALPVTIVEAQDAPLIRATGAEMGGALARLHERNGTTVRCGRIVQSLQGKGRVEAVVLDDGSEIPADLVVVGIGVTPATDWLLGSGLDLTNGISCDENLWTGIDGIYAAGDTVSWPNSAIGVTHRLENWTAAAEQGAAAARNVVSRSQATPYATVPYFWSDWYGSRIQFVGSAESDEVQAVEGDPSSDGRWIALYRSGSRLIGALTVNAPTEIMKYRSLIQRAATWDEAMTFAATRRATRAPATRRRAGRRVGAQVF